MTATEYRTVISAVTNRRSLCFACPGRRDQGHEANDPRQFRLRPLPTRTSVTNKVKRQDALNVHAMFPESFFIALLIQSLQTGSVSARYALSTNGGRHPYVEPLSYSDQRQDSMTVLSWLPPGEEASFQPRLPRQAGVELSERVLLDPREPTSCYAHATVYALVLTRLYVPTAM